jgi:hypothetical protein
VLAEAPVAAVPALSALCSCRCRCRCSCSCRRRSPSVLLLGVGVSPLGPGRRELKADTASGEQLTSSTRTCAARRLAEPPKTGGTKSWGRLDGARAQTSDLRKTQTSPLARELVVKGKEAEDTADVRGRAHRARAVAVEDERAAAGHAWSRGLHPLHEEHPVVSQSLKPVLVIRRTRLRAGAWYSTPTLAARC